MSKYSNGLQTKIGHVIYLQIKKKSSTLFITDITMKGSCNNYFISDHVIKYSYLLNLQNLKYSDFL